MIDMAKKYNRLWRKYYARMVEYNGREKKNSRVEIQFILKPYIIYLLDHMYSPFNDKIERVI